MQNFALKSLRWVTISYFYDSIDSLEEFQETYYCFNEKEVFRALPFGKDVKIHVSGECISLEAESDGKSFSAVRPFASEFCPSTNPFFRKNFVQGLGLRAVWDLPLQLIMRKLRLFFKCLGQKKQS